MIIINTMVSGMSGMSGPQLVGTSVAIYRHSSVYVFLKLSYPCPQKTRTQTTTSSHLKPFTQTVCIYISLCGQIYTFHLKLPEFTLTCLASCIAWEFITLDRFCKGILRGPTFNYKSDKCMRKPF